MKTKLIIFLLLGIHLISFRSLSSIDSDGLSALVIKLKYNSYGMTGFGGSLRVRNIKTDEVFESKSKKGFNPFVIIENVPSGNYIVERLDMISGPNVLKLANKSDFNVIKVNESRIYYLGNYEAKKIPPLMKLNFAVMKSEQDSEEKVYKQLKKKSDSWLKLKIDFGQSLFVKDSTTIEIKNHR